MRLSYDKSQQPKFQPHPAGVFPGVCVDVIDLGLQPTAFGEKHQCQLVFETNQRTEDGSRPMTVRSRRFTASLSEKANLRKFLGQWRGAAITDEEALDFDLDTLIGVPCMLSIVHEPNKKPDEPPYANIGSIMPLMEGVPRLVPSKEYVRVCNRPPEDQAKITARRELPPTPAAEQRAEGAQMQRALAEDQGVYRDAVKTLDKLADEAEDDLPF